MTPTLDVMALAMNARNTLDFVLLIATGLIATRIVWRLIFSDLQPDELVTLASRIIRVVLTMTYATISIRVWVGWYWTPVEPSEVVANLLVLLLVEATGGDTTLMLDALRELRRRKRKDLEKGASQ